MNDNLLLPIAARKYIQKKRGEVIHGKTTQPGTPTPENPIPLYPQDGLHGIPVASGGNYTDKNGQQWICDEIDFERGKYVQRVARYTFPDNSFIVAENGGYPVGNSLFFRSIVNPPGTQTKQKEILCSKLPYSTNALKSDINGCYSLYGRAYCRIEGVSDVSEFNALMNGAEFVYILETPNETDLKPDLLQSGLLLALAME